MARRKTIALCLDYIHPFSQGYQANVRQALDEQCRSRDINLLAVLGRAIEEPNPLSQPYNAIYTLLHPDTVDGVIILSATLGGHCGVTGIQRFVRHLGQIPCCSLGLAVPNVSSVTLDNRQGMTAVMDHMLEQHGYRRIAFLAGTASSMEAQVRFQAYREALERHDIDFDPEIVRCGEFQMTIGRKAMAELIAKGSKIDAIVAANDLMALGAILALRAHGDSFSSVLPITGFDDLPACCEENPPLTSVAQPYAAMAERALEIVLAQIAGNRVPDTTELPPRLILRQSCGCNSRAHVQPNFASAVIAVSPQSDDPCAASVACIDKSTDLHTDATTRLADIRHYLLSRQARQIDLTSRTEMLKLVGIAPEWVVSQNTDANPNHLAAADETLQNIVSVNEYISTALDVPTLCAGLHEVLPQVGVKTAFLSRFIGTDPTELESLVSLRRGELVPFENSRFPARWLFPREVLGLEPRLTMAAFPIVYDGRLQGIAVFEYSDDKQGYQLIRDQIAIAMRSVALHQAVVEQTKLHERSLQEQERLATTKRLQALSVLAGGVAHDLNNALGPMVALPDIMQRAFDALDQGQETVVELRADLRSMKDSSLRAAQIVKDLLTLSRQGRTSKEPIDLGKLVSLCADGDARSSIRRLNDQVEFVVIAPDTPVIVRGSEAHLVRAINNLVRNAAEAIQGAGRVTLKVDSAMVVVPVSGFETVVPGEYAIVTVTDNGGGIASADLGRIFEPFTSQKRLGEQSGSGLGLAIVHGVVKEHDGFIDVSSVLGLGTTFTLYFPRSTEVVSRERRSSALKHGSAKILVVDDDPTQLRTCRRVLAHLGYEVDTLVNGQDAIALFEQGVAKHESPYDLVILDMILHQNFDGLEVYGQIKQYFPSQKAIIASGYAAVERAEAAVQSGLLWLVKPYTAEGLAQAVHAVLVNQTNPRFASLSSRPSRRTERDDLAGC